MMRACIPLSLKYSPIAQAEYGARYCSGAASDAVALTTIEYFMASAESVCVCVYYECVCVRACACVCVCTAVREPLDNLSYSAPLLADGDVDRIQLLLLVISIIEPLLIDDGVYRNRRLTVCVREK